MLHATLDAMGVNERVNAHRRRMRESGLRQVQIWVPDVRSERFASEAHRQSQAVATSDATTDDQAFMEAVAAPWDE
jgi:hypothetical protein